jgi:hypothetical protein
MTTDTPTELTDLEIRKAQYEAKRQARYDRLLAASRKAQNEAGYLIAQAHDMASIIPFGQPILVGHYSEGRDRRYRGRIDSKYRKGFELTERAAELRDRADSALNNTSIRSDDPTAIDQLKEKLAGLEAEQERMKAVNKAIKKNDRAGLAALGYNEAEITSWLTTPQPYVRGLGYPSYALTNNNANIRRIKERIKDLEKHANDVSTEWVLHGVTITDNVEDNRLQLTFPGKPSEEVRHELKSRGFRWTPTAGVWQAYRGPNAKYSAEQIITKFYAPKVEA